MTSPATGRDAAIYLCGAATTMTAEPATDMGAHAVYRITDATRRAISPAYAVAVCVDSVEQAEDAYAIDYALGTITFSSPLSGGEAVTITGRFLPLLALGLARGISVLPPQSTFADATLLGDASARRVAIGRRCELTIDHVLPPRADIDPGDETTTLAGALGSGEPIFVVAGLADGRVIRGFFAATAATMKAAVGGLLGGSVSLVGVVQTPVSATGTRGEQAIFALEVT